MSAMAMFRQPPERSTFEGTIRALCTIENVFVVWYLALESWLSPSARWIPLPAKANVFHSNPFPRKSHAKFIRISASFAHSHSVHRDTASHGFSSGLQEIVQLQQH
jgi:hypothetical protein